MKDIKSFLIGFLSCVCLMLFMGQTNQPDNNIGRYQGFSGTTAEWLVDTSTGQLYFNKENPRYDKYKWIKTSAKLSD